MHKAPDSFMVGISEKKSLFPLSPPKLSFCAEPKAKSQNPSSHQRTLDLRERKDQRKRWVREGGMAYIHHPSSAMTGNFIQGRRFFSLFNTPDYATPGKPYFQNEMKAMESSETNNSMVESLNKLEGSRNTKRKMEKRI